MPCQPDPNYYHGGVALRVDAYKQDGSWLRLQPMQTLLPLAAISVQTSAEAVVTSIPVLISACASVLVLCSCPEADPPAPILLVRNTSISIMKLCIACLSRQYRSGSVQS